MKRFLKRERDTIDIANPVKDRFPYERGLILLSSPTRSIDDLSNIQLSTIEDRREFNPTDYQVRTMSGAPHRLALYDKRVMRKQAYVADRALHPSQTKARIGFATPQNVLVCVRRKMRKEVLFALGKAGGGARRPPRRNWTSYLACE